MAYIKKYFILLIVVLFILISCKTKDIYLSENGFIDLSEYDFENSGIVSLSGNWEFYWNELLDPVDFDNNERINKDYCNVPCLWTEQTGFSIKKYGKGCATYRIKIKMNKIYQNSNLSLNINYNYSAYKIFVNNKMVMSCGLVSDRSENFKPKFLSRTRGIDYSDEIEIIVQIANFAYGKGGFEKTIDLGLEDQINNMKNMKIAFDLFIFVFLFISGIYHLVIFSFKNILKNNDYSGLFFGLISIFASIRVLTTGNMFLTTIFPDFNWYIQMKISLLTTYLSPGLFLCFFNSIYKNKINKIFLYSSVIVSGIFGVITLLTGPDVFFYIPFYNAFFVTVIIFGIYCVYFIINDVVKTRNIQSVIFLAGAVIFTIFLFIEELHFNWIFRTVDLINFAFLIFIFVEAVLLAYQHSFAYYKIEQLNQNLEQKVYDRIIQLEEEKNKKTNFFINLAHETKTPLTLIKNYMEYYFRHNKKTYELEVIEYNINKLSDDMCNFLDCEKIEKGEILYNHDQYIDINEMLSKKIELFRPFAKKNNVLIDYKKNTGVLSVKIDPYAFDRIINNLIYNAVKFNDIDTLIRIEVKKCRNNIILSIKANGQGISECDLENIFKPYYQMNKINDKNPGYSMELYTIKFILENLGYKLNVRSEINNGTIIEIIFPENNKPVDDIDYSDILTKPCIEKNPELVSCKNNCNKQNTLLIVEDNNDLLLLLEIVFSEKYNVVTAVNGRDAIGKLSMMTTKLPDLIISDVMMPVMDGNELLSELKNNKSWKSIPVILLTAITKYSEKIKSLDYGAIDFISKPFYLDEIKAKVKTIITNSQIQKESNIRVIENKISLLLRNTDLDMNNINGIINSKMQEIINSLTPKRKKVFNLLIEGKQLKEIAGISGISINTAKSHLHNILKLFNVSSTVEMINKIYNLNNHSNN